MTFQVPPAAVVVDASIAVDVLTEPDDPVEALWARWLDEGRSILAPPLIWLEVANALLRGKHLPSAIARTRLEYLEASGLEAADRGPVGVRASLDLAERHGLTVYDAAYLWLAIDVDGELATRDSAVARAAGAEGVALALG